MNRMEEFASFIQSLGGLHDAEATALVWTPAQAEIRISVADINANFEGLPEYEGKRPGTFIFSGVTDVVWSVDRPDSRLKIYDWEIELIPEGCISTIKISPSGRLVIHCAAIALSFG